MTIDDFERIIEMMRRLAMGMFELDDLDDRYDEIGEIQKTDDKIFITFEFKDAPEDLKIKASKNDVLIEYEDELGPREKRILLPCTVNPKSLKYSIKNGIVDIELEKINGEQNTKSMEKS